MSRIRQRPGACARPKWCCGRRDVSGSAFSWEPGGRSARFLAFVGPHLFAVVDGKLYKREGDGTSPRSTCPAPMIVVKPMAGDPFFHSPAEFKRTYSVIVTPVVPLPSSLMFSPGFVQSPPRRSTEPTTPRGCIRRWPPRRRCCRGPTPPCSLRGRGRHPQAWSPEGPTNKASQS